jgi:hypothetical protein
MTTRRLLVAALACVVLAALSLLIADEPVYDVWAWLVWGRELAHGGLDAASGPSWKPLPVILAAPLSLAGAAAPDIWLVFVRAAWLLSVVLAAELAFLLSAGRTRGLRIAAGTFAAVGVVLLSDDVTQWARQVAGGMGEPLLVALTLGAVRAGLDRRVRTALLLGAVAALIRPEGWPLLIAYGSWCWRDDARARPLAIAVVLGVPLLWLAPELLGAGSGSAGRAETGTSDPREALGWALALPLAVAWPLALVALRDRRARVLAAGAVAWIAIVALMTLAGFAGLPRFMTPAAALVCVLGGAGLAHLVARPRALLVAVVAPLLVLTGLGLRDRVNELPHAWRSSARIAASHDRLRTIVHAVGRDRLLYCGHLATSDALVRTGLAWDLGVPLADVVSFGDPPRLSGAFFVGLQASPALRRAMRTRAREVASDGEWRLYSLDCPVTASASAARSAGVSGATR